MEDNRNCDTPQAEPVEESPEILEEIAIEELAIDGICGVY
jgi:mycofactocin precursor